MIIRGKIIVLYDKECLTDVPNDNRAWQVDASDWQLEEKYSKGDIVKDKFGFTFKLVEKWQSTCSGETEKIYYVAERIDSYMGTKYSSHTFLHETNIVKKSKRFNTYKLLWYHF